MCREVRRAVHAAMSQEIALPVRLSEEEMDHIDSLIAEGVFDSREDAVGYFLSAGIGSVPQVLAEEPAPQEEVASRVGLVNLVPSDSESRGEGP